MCLQRVTTQNENIVKYMSILIFEKIIYYVVLQHLIKTDACVLYDERPVFCIIT